MRFVASFVLKWHDRHLDQGVAAHGDGPDEDRGGGGGGRGRGQGKGGQPPWGGKFEINEITKKVNHHGKIITVGAKREKDQPRDAKSKQLIQVN